MKKRNTILTILLLSFVAICYFSCTKNEVDDIAENLIGTMECKINNITWKATAPVGTINSGKLVITGIEGKKNISLTFHGTTVGDYNITITEPGTIYISNVDSTSTTTYAAFQGLIKLTKMETGNKKASGSFNFTAINPTSGDTISIANGSFANVNYTN